MSMNESGVANVALAQILKDDVQAQLSAAPVLINAVTNLSDKAGPGMKSVSVPRVSGLAAGDIPDDGSDSTDGGMVLGVDTLTLNQKREVAGYIYDTAQDSAVDVREAFFGSAPGVLVADMESIIYAELDGASASNPDHILQMSGSSNLVPTIGDLRLAQKLMDDQNLPQEDRYLAVTPAIYSSILALSEVSSAASFGMAGATQKGYIPEIYGMKILKSTKVTASTMVAFHKSALAFAFQKNVTPVITRNEEKAREFNAVRAHYGVKVLDSGKRCILFNATGS